MTSADLIGDFGFPVTVTRYAAGAYVNGIYTAGATSTFDTVMSIQSLNGRELLLLPEGERTKNYAKGFASVELKTANQTLGTKADRITDGYGKIYEVQKTSRVESLNSDIAPWWRVLLAEVNNQ